MLVWCSRAAALASRWKRIEDLGVEQPMVAQHLQGHATAQRLLLGLVDDPHPAAADLSQQIGSPPAARSSAPSPGTIEPPMLPLTSPVPGLKSSTSPSTGKNSRISPARSRITRGVLLQRRSFAPPPALEELLGEVLDRRLIWRRHGHGRVPDVGHPVAGRCDQRTRSSRPGICSSMT